MTICENVSISLRTLVGRYMELFKVFDGWGVYGPPIPMVVMMVGNDTYTNWVNSGCRMVYLLGFLFVASMGNLISLK